MKKAGLYLLVRDEPEGFKEFIGMVLRQGDASFDLVALVPPGLSPHTMHRCEANIDEIHTVDDGDVGSAINRLAFAKDDDVIVVLDSGFMPSNQVWLNRLMNNFDRGNAQIVIGRLVHDLYTNWFIQNDFRQDEKKFGTGVVSPFYFQFSAFAVTVDTLRKTPFPKGDADEFAMRWALLNPAPVKFEKDAATACLDAISVDRFVSSYSRYSRETGGLGRPFRESLKLFYKGLGRDAALMWEKKMPLWLFFSLYLRFRQTMGYMLGACKVSR